jgi:ubiquinone/menaquinone biosynthesis C-methylase UbiE
LSSWTQKRSVKRRYDLTAGMYNRRYAEEQEAKYKVTLARLKPTGLVLDIGCGTGLLFNHIFSENGSMVGVDVSKKLLLQAREKARKQQNVYVVQADADHSPFRDSVFKTVFVFTVLQNMPKPSETLKEIYRVMQREAFVVVTGLKKVFYTESLRMLLGEAGFFVVSVEDDEKVKCYIAVGQKIL